MADNIISKKCSKCKQVKPISEFPRQAQGKHGRHNQCKRCKYEWAKTPKAKAYQKMYNREYGQREKVKLVNRLRHAQIRLRDMDKCAARSAVSNAVKYGRMPPAKTLRCICCPQPAAQWHHHLGYAPEHWLDVIPVCHLCHKLLDEPREPFDHPLASCDMSSAGRN